MNTGAVSSHSWQRRFFTIWTGQALSLFGSSLAGFALVWWLTSTTGSASVLAGATLMMILPQVFLGPLAGALVDRWSRRKVMIIADSLIALFSLGLVLLFAAGAARFWHVYAILLIRAVGSAFHTPAMQASTPLMVPEKHLNRVAGMNSTLDGVRNIVSPPLGALLLSLLPVEGVLMIDVVTALVAVLPLLAIAVPNPRPSGQAQGAPKSSLGQDMRAGLRFLRGWPALLAVMLSAAALNILIVPCMSMMPLLVTQHFRLGALELGWLQMFVGLGAIAGGLLLSVWGGLRSRMMTILLAVTAMGVGYLLMGAAPAHAFVLALFGSLVGGIASPVVNGLVFAMLQAVVPPEMQGRVFSLLLSAAGAAVPLGLAIAGPLSDALGVQFWFILSGVVTTGFGLVSLFIPAMVRLEERRPARLTAEPVRLD